MGFAKSAEIGRVGEGLVRQLMDWAGVETSPNDSNDYQVLKGHDIRCVLGGVTFSVEAKFDAMEAATGNIAIEHHNPKVDKPSGLMATTSDLWAIVLQEPTAVWICRTEDLKRYFATEKPLRKIKRGGDGNASLHLFKSERLLKAIFKRIDQDPPWDVLETIKNLLQDKIKHDGTHLAHPLQDRQQFQGIAVGNFDFAC